MRMRMRWCSGRGSEVISVPAALALAPTVTASFFCFWNTQSESVVFQFQNRKPLFKFKFNTFSSLSLTHHHQHRKLLVVPNKQPNGHCRPQCSAAQAQPQPSRADFVVVNFYHFVFIKDPQAEVAKQLSFLELKGLDINGRVYLNEQGINAQYSGPSKDALAYVNWLREDNRFSDILVQIAPSENGHTFPKLKLRYKPSLVQFEGGISHRPLLDPSMRAIPLAPSEWRNRLEAINKTDLTSADPNSNYILLDVRNGIRSIVPK